MDDLLPDDAWRAAGRHVEVRGDAVFVRDEPAADPDPDLPPLLVLHGFPTCSYDFAAVLPRLAAQRRVVLPDHLGHGLSSKPDRRYGIRMLADAVEGVVGALGIDEVDLLTHDVGDSVGGELLARSLDGTLGFDVRRRVLTNGSIYMDLAQLSVGQNLLLSLPDEPTDLVGADGWIGGLRNTFAPGSVVADEELEALWRLNAHEDGHRMLPRTIRYIEDRRTEERRYTGPIETHPSPLGVVWGKLDPIAVHAMAERLVAARPGTPLVTLEDVGHYPMLEAPDRFVEAVLALLDG
jgi:pimeloyl-ACP methyl ester carboxylesterase